MKFAHIADAHLGAFSKNPKLKEFNIKAFEMAIEKSMEEEVDFILIAGDLFHNPIPDMDVVKRGVEALKKATDRGIRIYAIYGSHDFSAGSTSLLDVLNSTGLFKKVVGYQWNEDRIRLEPVRDKTGVSIVGISGLSSAREIEYFHYLDMEYLESIENPKIFTFHTTITELKPSYINEKYSLPKSMLPRGFDYYAAGHLHKRIEDTLDGSPLIYPGPLFGATYHDLNNPEERGFYVVEDFKPRFVEVEVCRVVKRRINVDGLSAKDAEEKIMSVASQDYGGAVVVVKIEGELISGEIGEIDFQAIRERFRETAEDVLLSTSALRRRERERISVKGETKEDIENEVFKKISKYGVDITRKLFDILREKKPDDMTKDAFQTRLVAEVESILREIKIENVDGERRDKGREKKTLFDFGVSP